jgi:peptidoglycan/xylan/chitin deacetylase (PgdA/CDA1 family)
MNRRQFVRTAALGAVALKLGGLSGLAKSAAPQFSITMDDFFWSNAYHLTAQQRNQSILDTLKKHNTKAAMFVIGRNIESDEGKQLLSAWNDAGHLIGNHTYSHRSLNSADMTAAEYQSDISKAEVLLKEFPRFKKYFRFPMLKEGDTAAKRDGVRAFLTNNGYRTGHVTIDTADWAIDPRLIDRLKQNPGADLKPYRDFYLEHVWDRAQYYDSLARKVLGRTVKHTILSHFNLLNGLFLDDLITMLKSKGWELIDAETAFKDSVFDAKPKVLPAGESIVWALAKANGTIAKSLRYPAEDGNSEVERMKKLGL